MLALRRSQTTAAARLLLVAIDEAARVGRLPVAEELFQRFRESHPGHAAAESASAVALLRSEAGQELVAAARRSVSFEEIEAWVEAIPDTQRILAADVTARPAGEGWLD